MTFPMESIPVGVRRLAEAYRVAGGRALMVGGSVRDVLLGLAPHDIDLEVYGLSADEVERVLRTFGDVVEVGKAFAILKVAIDGVEIDVGLPRKEVKTGEGHKGFSVEVDPYLDPREAARRRDFTINAIAADLLTGEIVDPFGGVKDVEDRVLRVVDASTFGEDPLRVLRAMQFVARFGLVVEERSFTLMQRMAPTLREISPERIGGEWRKLLLKSEKPSLGLDFGMKVGAFAVLHPELVALEGTPQEPEWHPEGNVWIHSMMVTDEAKKIVVREDLADDEALVVLLGSLCHDFGKPEVTCTMNGRIRSPLHEEAGEVPARNFLQTLYIDNVTIAKVVGIVKDHMKPYRFWDNHMNKGEPVSDGAIRRLAGRIHPATMCQLVCVTEADYRGRGPFPGNPPREYPAGPWLLSRARGLEVADGPASHAVTGQELLEIGFAPGPELGRLIALADSLRDDEGLAKEAIMERLRLEQK